MRKVIFLALLGLLSSITSVNAQNDIFSGLLIDWHPGGEMLAYTYNRANEVVIVDADTGNVLNRIDQLDMQFATPKWSPDGEHLAIVNAADIEIWANAWDPATANRETTFKIYEFIDYPSGFSLDGLEWSPSGAFMVAFVGTGIFRWDIATGQLYVVPPNDSRRTTWDIIWYDEERLLIGDNWPSARIIESASGIVTASFLIRGTTGISNIRGVSLSPDGSLIALGGGPANRLFIWDATQGIEQERFGVWTEFAEREVIASNNRLFSVDWNATGDYIATSDQGGVIRVWNAETLELMQEYDQGVTLLTNNSAVWSPDGLRLAFGMPPDNLQIVEIPPITPINTPPIADAGPDQTVTAADAG